MEEVLSGKIIREVMNEKRVTQLEMAGRLGVKGQGNISDYLKRDMKYSLFLRFLNICGYEVELVDKTHGIIRDQNGDIIDSDVKPVQSVEPIKTGKGEWVRGRELKLMGRGTADTLNSIIYCSNCMSEAIRDSKYGQQLTDYCPCCGASMREEE